MPYMLNGRSVSLSEEPVQRDGRHYVPLAEIVRELGGSVDWDNEAKVATSVIGPWTASIRMADENVEVRGQDGRTIPVTLSAPPIVENDTLYVPWDFFKSVYGYKAAMNNGTLDIHL